jgi:hypothetical protein
MLSLTPPTDEAADARLHADAGGARRRAPWSAVAAGSAHRRVTQPDTDYAGAEAADGGQRTDHPQLLGVIHRRRHDFVARLVDVSPDGSAKQMTRGWLKATRRVSDAASTPLEAGKIYEFSVTRVA